MSSLKNTSGPISILSINHISHGIPDLCKPFRSSQYLVVDLLKFFFETTAQLKIFNHAAYLETALLRS